MSEQRIAALEARLKRVEAVLKDERKRNRALVKAHLDLIEMLQKDHRVTAKRMKMLVNDYQRVYQWVYELHQERDSGDDED